MRTSRTYPAVTSMDRATPRRPGIRALTVARIALAAFGPFGRSPRDASANAPTTVGEATTSARSHLRSGPGPAFAILCTVPAGEGIQASNTVHDGFRYVVHLGRPGWMDDRLIAWPA